MKAKYLCPFTSFGFVKIFGEEASIPMLKDLFNALLPLQPKDSKFLLDTVERLELTYLHLQIRHFEKQESELKTRLDQWLYFIKYLEDFQSIPATFRDEVFVHAFEKAELAKLSQEEVERYEYSLKIFRDNRGVIDYARQKGYAQGIAKAMGVLEVVRSLKKERSPIETIMGITGLSREEIELL